MLDMDFPSLRLLSNGFEKVSCSTARQRNTRAVAPSLSPLGSYMIHHVTCVSYGIGQISCTWLNFVWKTFVLAAALRCSSRSSLRFELGFEVWIGALCDQMQYKQGVALVPEIPSGHAHPLGWRCRWAVCHGRQNFAVWEGVGWEATPQDPAASPGGRWVCWIAPQGQPAPSTQTAGPGHSNPAPASDCSSKSQQPWKSHNIIVNHIVNSGNFWSHLTF